MTGTPPTGAGADQPPPPPRTVAPTAESMANRAAFAALVDASLESTRTSAEKWRTGLAALVTLVTTALLLKGPEAANDLGTGWRVTVTVLLGTGLILAVAGLWFALSAASGVPSTTSYDAIIGKYRSVKAFQVAEANTAARQLTVARLAVVAALLLLMAGMFSWWWAPKAAGIASVTVTTGNGSVCGELVTADHGEMRLTVAGTNVPQVIRMRDIVAMKTGRGC